MSKPNLLLYALSVDDLKDLLGEVLEEKLSLLKSEKKDLELITRQEASKILGVSLPTLHKLTKNGEIPAFRVSNQIRYKKQSILDNIQIQIKPNKK